MLCVNVLHYKMGVLTQLANTVESLITSVSSIIDWVALTAIVGCSSWHVHNDGVSL